MGRDVRKQTIGHVRLAKIQISLRIRAVWSESSLGKFWIAKGAKFLHADNEDSDQTAWMHKLIWVFVGRTCQKVRFLRLRLMYCWAVRAHDILLSSSTGPCFSLVYNASFILCYYFSFCQFGPRREKCTLCDVRPAKTQISLHSTVWSIFTVRLKIPWPRGHPVGVQRRIWSDSAYAQSDQSVTGRTCLKVHAHVKGTIPRTTAHWYSGQNLKSWLTGVIW